jgi:hypothetical protein
MSNTTTVRATSKKIVFTIDLPVAAATKILGGTIVDTNALGFAVAGPTGIRSWGIASDSADNTSGAAGDIPVNVRLPYALEVRLLANDTGSPLTRADVGRQCFVLDNQTVTGSSATGDPGPFVYEVTPAGVWVFFLPTPELDSGLQVVSGVLVAGVLTINTGITVTANTKVLSVLPTLRGGTFPAGGFQALTADMVPGAPGTGTLVVKALQAGGTVQTSCTDTVNVAFKG